MGLAPVLCRVAAAHVSSALPPVRRWAGAIGPDLFRHACLMGLEGLVSKRADSRHRSGRSPDWVKVKNRRHPAMERVMEAMS